MKNLNTLKNHFGSIWIFLFLLAFASVSFGQSSHHVAVTNNVFTPAEITIAAGDTVIWTNTEGNHNVNGDQSVFPSNPESFGNAVGPGWTFSYVFTIPGIYDYQCDPHVAFNMFGKVNVEGMGMDTLFLNFTAMSFHSGQELFLRIVNNVSEEEVFTYSREIEDVFVIEAPILETGSSYNVDFFADHNYNGSYDAPPTDHAWRIVLESAEGNEVLDFAHNPGFTDIEFNGPTGIRSQVGDHELVLYPNPSSGNISLRANDIIEAVKVYAVTGAQIEFFNDLRTNFYQFSIEDYDAGVYLMELEFTDGKREIVRVLKK